MRTSEERIERPLDLVDINLPVGERLGTGPDVGDIRVDAVR
jgi:hypothetical protein